jgi:hypothetical protein
MRTSKAPLLVVGFAIWLVACTGSGTSQPARLTIGPISFAEYQADFLAFQSCLVTRGQPLQDVQLDPSTQLYNYTVTAASDASGAMQSCYTSSGFASTDQAWQINPERPRPGYQRLTAVEVLAECLRTRNVQVPRSATFTDLQALLPANGLTVEACISEAQRAHP